MTQLSKPESEELAHHEAVIGRGLNTFREVGSALAAIRDRRLYRASHKTFEAYLQDRWDIKRTRAYELMGAASVAADLSEISNKDALREAHAVELRRLPADHRAETWDAAVATAPNGSPTAKQIREIADRRQARQEANALPEPVHEDTARPADDREDRASEPAPRVERRPGEDDDLGDDGGGGISRVNGTLTVDPADIAARRAAGEISMETIVEIDNPSPVELARGPASQAESADGPLSDDEWLENLKIRNQLSPNARRIFDRDALAYRQLEPALKVFNASIQSLLEPRDRKAGNLPAFLYKLNQFRRLDDPTRWTVCPGLDHGGCGGAGEIPMTGKCQKCHGGGYLL